MRLNRFRYRRKPQRTYVLLPPSSSCTQSRRRVDDSVKPEVLFPTDLLFSAWRQVFPAERMLVLGGRRTKRRVQVTSVSDVSEARPSRVHVRADPGKLVTTLVDLERTGAHLAVWMHSHPGSGPTATHPSDIDLRQEDDLRRHYSQDLICIIAVADGYFRLWGKAVEAGTVSIRWQGEGITQDPGEPHVYRLQLS